MKLTLALGAVLLAPLSAPQSADLTNREPPDITSPNGKPAVTTGMDDSGGITYAFQANGRKLISPSTFGLDFDSPGDIPRTGWKTLT